MELSDVRCIGLLERFTEEDVRTLLTCATDRVFRKDDEVLPQGRRSASLFLVQSGVLQVRRRLKDRHLVLARLEPGQFFGEITLLSPGETTAAVRALTPGNVLEMRRDQFDDFLGLRPQAALRMVSGILAEVASRLRTTDERLFDTLMWGGRGK